MTRAPAGLMARVIAYFSVRDFIPFYGVYALLFADHGLSASAISSLFIAWSVTSFVAEVPSGAWADTVSRRALLVLSSVLYALGFSLWIVVPSYPGFLAGFVLWGISSALMSGTFEALLYDELAARQATDDYPRLMGWANSAAMVANLTAAILAAPLLRLGGYALVGWVSVAVALVQGAFALSLPPAPKSVALAGDDEDEAGTAAAVTGYMAMLRAGVREASLRPRVRNAVVIASFLLGALAYDEYFPLVAREHGSATDQVPLLMAIVVAGQAVGTALAGRTARLRSRVLASVLVAAAVLLGVGALRGGILGWIAVGIGYGIVNDLIIVSEARLQDQIEGRARATVTSVSGFLSEVAAVAVFAGFALGSTWLSVTTMVVLLSIPLLLVAWLVPRWLPEPTQRAPQAREP